MQTVRTPAARFADLPDYPYRENYVDFEGIRMHYLDEGSGETILALHGEPSWSFLYRKFIPVLTPGHRFIAPDLIGFGKSDKIVGWRDYSYDLHFRSLENLIDRLELNDITLIVQDWGGLLGLALLGAHPRRFKRVVILNTFLPRGNRLPLGFRIWQWFARYHPSVPVGRIIQYASFTKLSREVIAAYNAPHPGRKYKDGAKSFPSLVPSKPTDGGVDRMNEARRVLSEWTKPALVLFSDKDPVLSGFEGFFYDLIPTAQDRPRITIENAGHFLQEEKGEEIAGYVKQFMAGTLNA
ncbi:MAG: haloalkane dehalogenase [Saprospiraceae bacterium]